MLTALGLFLFALVVGCILLCFWAVDDNELAAAATCLMFAIFFGFVGVLTLSTTGQGTAVNVDFPPNGYAFMTSGALYDRLQPPIKANGGYYTAIHMRSEAGDTPLYVWTALPLPLHFVFTPNGSARYTPIN